MRMISAQCKFWFCIAISVTQKKYMGNDVTCHERCKCDKKEPLVATQIWLNKIILDMSFYVVVGLNKVLVSY